MNLIQQLQQTPKWKELKDWYIKQDFKIPLYPYEGNKVNGYNDINGFIDVDSPHQKGVFEKFIESQEYHLCTERRKNGKGLVLVPILYKIPEQQDNWTQCLVNDNCDSFEQLLIWYFNQ